MRPADLSAEGGMTIIEVLVAITILAVALLPIVASMDSSTTLISTAERSEAALHVAEREIEHLHSLPYTEVALDGPPGTSPLPTDPRFYVAAGSPASYRWNVGSSPARYEPLLSGGTVSAAPTAWQSGRLGGTVHRFITWVDDPCCPGTQNYKRLTVAVTLDPPGRPKNPIVLSSLLRRRGV